MFQEEEKEEGFSVRIPAIEQMLLKILSIKKKKKKKKKWDREKCRGIKAS